MASLLELLQQSDPTIDAVSAASFRSCLVAMAHQLQDEEQQEALFGRSLSQWWQWLDDEGYERDQALRCARGVLEASIGADGLAELSDLCLAHADEPGGLPNLLELLGEKDAELPNRLQELEEQALAEHQDLDQIAGGMSKGAAIGVGVGVPVAVIIGGIIFRKQIGAFIGSWTKRSARNDVQALHREARHARTLGVNEIENALNQARHSGFNQREIHVGQEIEREVRDPLKPMSPGKSLEKLTEQELDHLTMQYFELHLREHGPQFVEENLMPEIHATIQKSPGYKEEVRRAYKGLETQPKYFIENNNVLRSEAERLAREGDQYQTWFRAILNGEGETARNMLDQVTEKAYSDIKGAYKTLLKAEVDLAKKEIADDINGTFYRALAREDALYQEFRTTVDQSIVRTARKLEAGVIDLEKALARDL